MDLFIPSSETEYELRKLPKLLSYLRLALLLVITNEKCYATIVAAVYIRDLWIYVTLLVNLSANNTLVNGH